jgi:hypothetical protein
MNISYPISVQNKENGFVPIRKNSKADASSEILFGLRCQHQKLSELDPEIQESHY